MTAGREMIPLARLVGALAVTLTLVLGAGACGGDDDDTTTTSGQSAEQRIDSAVQSCTDSAQNLGGATGSALQTACQQVGQAAKQDLSSAGADVRKTLSEQAATCRKAVNRLPSGDAQNALSGLCDAIKSAGQNGG
jgi:hypothetical protein